VNEATERPIFVIGTGRCGSTIVFEALTQHEELAWFSSYDDRFPLIAAASAAARIYDLGIFRRLPRGEKPQFKQGRTRLNKLLPKPSECYRKWEEMCGRKFRDDYLIGVHASSEERGRVRRAVEAAARLQGKGRFAAKLTGPPRIHYLLSIFPDAQFVHVVRDGRAVVNSLLNTDFWRASGALRRPKWNNGLPAGWRAEWSRWGRSSAALAAIQYRTILQVVDQERTLLGPGQFIEIRYEDFVEDARAVIHAVQEFAGLSRSPRVDAYVGASGRYRNMNRNTHDALTPEDARAVDEIVRSWTAVPVNQ
jgi:hypothetical protein